MYLLDRIFKKRDIENADEYIPLDAKRMARLRWALEMELAMLHGDEEVPPHPSPIMLVRQPRQADAGWACETSWLGGMPRLGDVQWPTGEDGSRLPFVAQIDIADIAEKCPDAPLPENGSFAFFIGSGALAYVPDGEHAKSEADEEAYLTQTPLPYWPVEAMALNLPAEFRIYADDSRHGEIRAAQSKVLHLQVPPCGQGLSIAHARQAQIASADCLWWNGAIYLARRFHRSQLNTETLIKQRERSIAQGNVHFEQLTTSEYRDEAQISQTRQKLARWEDEIHQLRDTDRVFLDFCNKFDEFVADKDPWGELTTTEQEGVHDALGEAWGRFEHVLLPGTPSNLDGLQEMCLRRMITADADTFAAMPEDMLDFINSNYRLAPGLQHQMFGLGHSRP